MSSPIISVENLSKRYVIGHQRPKGDDLRHALESFARSPWRWIRNRSRSRSPTREEFWALKDVSFEVNQSDVVGIIGRNGAGKSTLLKILSRITEPTSGRVRIRGRVASLLEVGTGFHPELTGRENIFLNGAILGMNKAEIARKFDEIVAFSEIEKFLDTAVKRYSSGMYVRLAFAVAAHLEPEILIVDEVLAVGDAAFQKKCLGRMDDAARAGRTVLFVSHQMGAVSRLCQHSVLLEKGTLRMVGPTQEVIRTYLKGGDRGDGTRVWSDADAANRDPRFRLRALRVLDQHGKVASRVDVRCPFQVEFEYRILQRFPRFRVAFRFLTEDGVIAFTNSDSAGADFDSKPTAPGLYRTRCAVPGNLLNQGYYSITLTGDIPFQESLFAEESAVGFHAEQTGGVSSRFSEKWPGTVCPHLEWNTQLMPEAQPSSPPEPEKSGLLSALLV